MKSEFSPRWIVAMTIALGFTAWIGLFSFSHVEFSQDLWWRFTVTGDAPRYLRAMVGSLTVIALFAFARLLRPAAAEPSPPSAAELDRAAALLATASASVSSLALLGDETLWFRESGRGMLMFAVSGRIWIAMGDPVGTPEDQRELVWRFREEADRHGAWTVFYETGAEYLPLSGTWPRRAVLPFPAF